MKVYHTFLNVASDFQGYEEWSLDCWDCFRRNSYSFEYYGRIPLVHVPACLVSAYAYYKCIVDLRKSKQISRKGESSKLITLVWYQRFSLFYGKSSGRLLRLYDSRTV